MTVLTRSRQLRVAAALSLLAAGTAPALAQPVAGAPPFVSVPATPDEVAAELVELLVSESRTASYGTATGSAGVVTVTGLTFTDQENGMSGVIDSIAVASPMTKEGGGFTSASATLTAGSLTDSTNSVTFDSVTITDLVVPPIADLSADSGDILPFSTMTAAGVAYVPPQAAPLIIEGVDLALEDVAEGVPYAISVALRGVEVPLEIADDSEPIGVVRAMGFETLVMDLDVAGAFDSDEDTLHLESVGIAIREFGRIQLSGTFIDMPLGNLQETGGLESLMASAKIESAVLRFENQGAIDRFLEAQAAASLPGTRPQDVAAGLSTAFRIGLRALGDPVVEQQLGAAMSAFLVNPIHITITVAPTEPQSLLAIVSYALSSPTIIPSLLGLRATAND